MSRLVLFILAVTLVGATGRAEPAFFGLSESARDGQRLEFEQWLKHHLMSQMQPLTGGSNLVISVRATLKSEKSVAKKKIEFSKLDVVEFAEDITPEERENFFRKIQAIEITLAHDGTLPSESLDAAKKLAKKLVPLVVPWRISVASLKVGGPVVAKRQVDDSAPVVKQQIVQTTPPQVVVNPQVDVQIPEPKPQVIEIRQIASEAPATQAVGQHQEAEFFRDYQILLGLFLTTVGLIVAAFVATRDRKLKGSTRVEREEHPVAAPRVRRDPSPAPMHSHDDVIDVTSRVSSEPKQWAGPDLAFHFPQEVVGPAFSELTPELKLILIANLETGFREEFLAKVAPANSKLGQFLTFELSRLRNNPIEWKKVSDRGQESFLAFNNAAFGVINANDAMKLKVQPIIDEWRKRHGTSHAAS